MSELDFSAVEIPGWLTLLGVLTREGWALFVEGWNATLAPLLASAPAWTIGLLVVVFVVAWFARR